MSLIIPHFPFRNTIIIDTNGEDNLESLARPVVGTPDQVATTKRPIIWAPHFPYKNYVHIRNTRNLTDDEVPAPPAWKGLKAGRFTFGGVSSKTLHHKYQQTSAINKQSEKLQEGDETLQKSTSEQESAVIHTE